MKNILVKNLSKSKNKEVGHTKQEVELIIDKKIPEIGNYINLTKIEMPATEGVRELRKLLEG